jgi:hypothetical protein
LWRTRRNPLRRDLDHPDHLVVTAADPAHVARGLKILAAYRLDGCEAGQSVRIPRYGGPGAGDLDHARRPQRSIAGALAGFAVSSTPMRYLGLLLCMAACSTEDADVTGDFSITVTNRDNGCNFAQWTAGVSSSAQVTLAQTGSDVTATVTGVGAIALELLIGGRVFAGEVRGNTLELTLFGTRSNMMGNCTYTFNAELHAVIDGDVLTGQIDYLAATNANPDCDGITSCRSFQDFNGTRPP